MRRIAAIAWKDLTLLLRDKTGFFFIFFFPLLYAIFFGTIFSGGDGGMRALGVLVVDQDRSEASRRFVERLAKAPELSVTEVESEEIAADRVRRGERAAYLVLPPGFGAARDRIFQGEGIHIRAGMDPARKAEAGMLQGVLMQYAFEMFQDLFQDADAMKRQAKTAQEDLASDPNASPLQRLVLGGFLKSLEHFLDELPSIEKEGSKEQEASGEAASALPRWEPVRVDITPVVTSLEGQPKSSFDITMPQAFIWVFMGCSAAFGLSLVTERTRGTLLRLSSAPIGLAHILAGKAAACFLMSLAALLLLFGIFYATFGTRPDSYPLLLLAFVCADLAFVGVMMGIASLGKTEAAASGIGWAVLIVMAMIGGGMLPLIMMPSWMRPISDVSFVKWSILAMEGAVWRGFTLTEMLLPCGILVGIGAACFAGGVLLFKRSMN